MFVSILYPCKRLKLFKCEGFINLITPPLELTALLKSQRTESLEVRGLKAQYFWPYLKRNSGWPLKTNTRKFELIKWTLTATLSARPDRGRKKSLSILKANNRVLIFFIYFRTGPYHTFWCCTSFGCCDAALAFNDIYSSGQKFFL